MYEQSDAFQLIEKIIDHPHNLGLDLFGRLQLRRDLQDRSYEQLSGMLEDLERNSCVHTKEKV